MYTRCGAKRLRTTDDQSERLESCPQYVYICAHQFTLKHPQDLCKYPLEVKSPVMQLKLSLVLGALVTLAAATVRPCYQPTTQRKTLTGRTLA